MSTSAIEWTERTWNPIVGCSILSPGCTNCYAMKMAARIQKMNLTGGTNSDYVNHYDGTTRSVNGNVVWTGKLAIAPDKIFLQPLSRKAPTTYFVNSMGDIFHEDVPDEWIDRVFAVMALAPQHTFQVLTKRADRMRRYLTNADQAGAMRGGIRSRGFTVVQRIQALCADFIKLGKFQVNGFGPIYNEDWDRARPRLRTLPLSNVWLGVSAERQQEWNERKEHLRKTPAAVRFASFEPLLGSIVELNPISDYLQWTIVGGESGPNSRPMHPDWARGLRDACIKAGVPFFFKQWGQFVPFQGEAETFSTGGGVNYYHPTMKSVGKKAAGRLLDGVEHNGFPAVRS
jgi:protein gp37